MDIYVVYENTYSDPPAMHSVHTTKELAELARLMILHQDKLFWEQQGETYDPECAPYIEVRKEQLITSYEDLGKMFQMRYVWDGE